MKVQVSRNRLGSFVLFGLAASCASPALFDTEPTGEPTTESVIDAASDGAPYLTNDTGRLGSKDAGDSGRVAGDAGRDARDASDASLVDADAHVDADAGPSFPFDTQRLVVSLTSSPTANADLYMISTTCAAPVPLTQTPGRHEVAPRWSPDHTKIAFLAQETAELLVMDADGSNVRVLASGVDGSLWPPAWSPDGARIAYMHVVPSCPLPWNPEWFETPALPDPCINDLHAVRLSDGVDEDLDVMPSNEMFGTEPAWLQNGKISYFWQSREDSYTEVGGWYRTLAQGTGASLNQWPPVNTIHAASSTGGWFRQRAHKHDPADWAAVEIGSIGLGTVAPSPVHTLNPPGEPAWAPRFNQGAILLCHQVNPYWTGGLDATCSRLVDDPLAWSPRWNPEESRVAYQRTDGLWVTDVPVAPGGSPTQLFAWSGEILGFDW